MEIAIGIGIGLVLGVVAVLVGRRGGKDAHAHEQRVGELAEALSRGRRPEGLQAGSAEARLFDAIERGYAPREQERQQALREAVGRVSGFLDRGVRAPLAGAHEGADAAELRERAERALGALDDLDFFVGEPTGGAERQNLGALVQQVAREFASDQDVGLRLRIGDAPTRAEVNAGALMDALYLVLHNAWRFGEGGTVDVTVDTRDGRAFIGVRDRGPGFGQEAFARAFDPFYSTSEDGLGLGLPHARKLVEGMGGRIEIRNIPDGGAEVEVSFPAA